MSEEVQLEIQGLRKALEKLELENSRLKHELFEAVAKIATLENGKEAFDARTITNRG